MHSSILLFVVFMGVLRWGWGRGIPATPHPLRGSAPLLALRAISPRAGGVCPQGEPFNYYRLWYMRSSSS